MFKSSLSPLIPAVVLVASATVGVAQQAAPGATTKLTFPNSDIRDVLAQYEFLVGKRLIYDNQVQGTVNINVPEVSREEAIRIIEITLIMNGYHIVPVDSDPNLLKVTGLSRAPRTVGVPLISDPEPLPENEQVVMYLVKLHYADPADLAQVLSQAMPPSRAEYAPNIVALPKAQSLLITENTTIIRSLQRIIRATDVEPVKVDGEFITLQRASAKDVVQMLEKMFEKPNTPTSGAAPTSPRPSANAANPGAPAPAAPAASSGSTSVEIGGMNEDSMISGKVRLTADERTNRVYVVSRPVNLPLLRKIIQGFDEDVRFDEPVVHQLKYVSAGDILEPLVKAIADPGSKDGAAGTGGGQRTPGSTTPSINNNSNQQFGSSASGSRSSGSTLASNMSLQTEAREIRPTTVNVGNSKIMADNRSNAIIVIGSADVKDKVLSLLKQLDVRAPQVMLSTVIGELTLADEESFGVNYLLGMPPKLRSSNQATPFVSSSSSGLNLDLTKLLGDSSYTRALLGGAGGFSGFVSAGRMDSIITALESSQRFRVTSRPSLFASNNKKATITSGEEIAVATSVQSGLSGNTTGSLVSNSSVQFKAIELRLEVVPLINSDREVYLDILQKVEEQTGETKVDNNSYPKISTRALNTSVMVPNEGTLALGGLIKHKRSKSVNGIPVLSKMPLLGPLFRSTEAKNSRTELVILIRPSVSLGPKEDIAVRDRNMEVLKIPANLEDTLIDYSRERVMDPIRFRSSSKPVKPEVVAPQVAPAPSGAPEAPLKEEKPKK